jgi:hypothetical protein
MTLYRAAWALWIIGTIPIILSWFRVVPSVVGWIGFGLAGLGVALSFVSHAAIRRPPPSETRDQGSGEPEH